MCNTPIAALSGACHATCGCYNAGLAEQVAITTGARVSHPGRTSSGLSESTSRSLLARAKANEPEAWERLAAIYSPVVYRWARQCKLQASDAADIVQEAFHAVAQHIDDFRRENPQDSFRAWLRTITLNKVRDHIRRRSARAEGRGGTEALQHLQNLPDQIADDSADHVSQDKRELSRRALDLMRTDFEERTWQAFWKTAVDGRPGAEVAAELNMSVAAVYMAKSRVLRRLRQELDGLAE